MSLIKSVIQSLFVLSLILVVSTNAFAGSWNTDSISPRKASSTKEPPFRLMPYAPGTNNLAIDVGQVFLMGDLASSYADSIGYQIHYTYGVSDIFGFDTSLGLSDHSDGKFSMATLLMGLRTNLSWFDKVVPYMIFGLGFYKPSRQLTMTSSASAFEFGVHLGPGVDLELTKQLFFGAAITFHDIFGTSRKTEQGVVDFGGTFTTFLLHLGVTL